MDSIINIVIIPSYVESTDSIYTRDERYKQTLKTISSIRTKIPNVFIVFIDISIFSNEELLYLNNNCDLVLNHYNNQELVNKVKSGKSYGEKSCIEYAILYLNNGNRNYTFNNFKNLQSVFKVGGRYHLNDNFNYHTWKIDTDIFHSYAEHVYKDACCTGLFKIKKTNIPIFIEFLEKYDEHILRFIYDIEKLCRIYVKSLNNCTHKEILGLTTFSSNGYNGEKKEDCV